MARVVSTVARGVDRVPTAKADVQTTNHRVSEVKAHH